MPAQNASETIVCLSFLLHIFAYISVLCNYKGKQSGPRSRSTLIVEEASKTFQQTTKTQTTFVVIGALRVIEKQYNGFEFIYLDFKVKPLQINKIKIGLNENSDHSVFLAKSDQI